MWTHQDADAPREDEDLADEDDVEDDEERMRERDSGASAWSRKTVWMGVWYVENYRRLLVF